MQLRRARVVVPVSAACPRIRPRPSTVAAQIKGPHRSQAVRAGGGGGVGHVVRAVQQWKSRARQFELSGDPR